MCMVTEVTIRIVVPVGTYVWGGIGEILQDGNQEWLVETVDETDREATEEERNMGEGD